LAGQPEAVPGLWNVRVASDIYWLSSQKMGTHVDGTKTYNTASNASVFERMIPISPNATAAATGTNSPSNSGMPTITSVASPSISAAGVQAQEDIVVHGRFRASRRHRCRFGFRHSKSQLTVAFTPAYVGEEGRFTTQVSRMTLVAHPSAIGTEYGSTLSCKSPVWHHGFRVVHLGIEYELELKQRDASMAAAFNYEPGARVEIDVGLLGLQTASMPVGMSDTGTLSHTSQATRLGYVVSHNHTSGRTLIDVPDVVQRNIFKSFLDVVLPDMLVYPIPMGDRAPEPVWMPVWQRACVWRECGYREQWERNQQQTVLYKSFHLFTGVPSKFVLYTKHLLLARSSKGLGDSLEQLTGTTLSSLAAPVSSVLSVQRTSGSYMLLACEGDGSSSALTSSSAEANSLVYRVEQSPASTNAPNSTFGVSLILVQHVPTRNARQWAPAHLLTSSGALVDLVLLASFDDNLTVYKWVSAGGLGGGGGEELQQHYTVPNSDGASGLVCLRIGSDSFVALAVYYNKTTFSYSTTSKLLFLHHTMGTVVDTQEVQIFPVTAASGVEHMIMGSRHFIAFLTNTHASASSSNTIVYEWAGRSASAATAAGVSIFKALQSVATPGGASQLKLLDLSGGMHLMISMHASCNTIKSGVQAAPGVASHSLAAAGECSAMLRWNGTQFVGPFISQLSFLRDTASGQELPGASAIQMLNSEEDASGGGGGGGGGGGAKDMYLSVNFEQQVKTRSAFAEVGWHLSSTRNTRGYLLTQRSEHLRCLAAPIALILDEPSPSSTFEPGTSRVLVLSYHMSAITIFDRCPTTGTLSLTPNVSQCVPALGNPAGGGIFRSERGAVGMVLSKTPQGCYGDSRYSRCVYVLDIGARPHAANYAALHAHEAAGAIHVFGLNEESGDVAFVSSLLAGSDVSPLSLPVSATVSRYVIGLGGGRALHMSEDGMVLLLSTWQHKGVTMLDRVNATGEITFADVMVDGERMTWQWSSRLPTPSPAA